MREWVSYEADRGSGGVVSDPASEPCHELPEAGEWGMWVAALGAAAHSRDLLCCVNRVEVIPSYISEEEAKSSVSNSELPDMCVVRTPGTARAERGEIAL